MRFEHIRHPDTGSLRGDLEAFFGAAMRTDLSGNVGQPDALADRCGERDPEMGVLLDRIGDDRERVCRRSSSEHSSAASSTPTSPTSTPSNSSE